MAEKQRKTGKKNRKFDRCKNKPSHKRYNNEERWKKNKEKKQLRHQKRLAKKLKNK